LLAVRRATNLNNAFLLSLRKYLPTSEIIKKLLVDSHFLLVPISSLSRLFVPLLHKNMLGEISTHLLHCYNDEVYMQEIMLVSIINPLIFLLKCKKLCWECYSKMFLL
jgi:hypothetical protein